MSTFVIVLILVVIGVFGVKSYCKKLSSGCCGASSGPSEKKMKVKDVALTLLLANNLLAALQIVSGFIFDAS